jgi:hypothetical protein
MSPLLLIRIRTGCCPFQPEGSKIYLSQDLDSIILKSHIQKKRPDLHHVNSLSQKRWKISLLVMLMNELSIL